MGKIESFRDLVVYQKLLELHFKVCDLTINFPKFELYELGSQMRRSSNSAPANLAEGWNNRHINIYIECANRALGEVHETEHHLDVAFTKKYLDISQHQSLISEYDTCGKMLKNLIRALEKNR